MPNSGSNTVYASKPWCEGATPELTDPNAATVVVGKTEVIGV